MGKYVCLLSGLAAIAFGIWGIASTWPWLWNWLKAVIPLLFVLGGALAVLIGAAEIRDSRKPASPDSSTPTPPSSPQS